MKVTKAVLIILFAVILEVSFIRVGNFIPPAINLPVIAVFLASYRLPFAGLMILSLTAGIFIDFFSGVSFGASALALIIVSALGFFLRENVFRAKTRGEFILNGFVTFFCYYPLVIIFNYFSKEPRGENFIPALLSMTTAEEILLNFLIGSVFYYFIFLYRGSSGENPILALLK